MASPVRRSKASICWRNRTLITEHTSCTVLVLTIQERLTRICLPSSNSISEGPKTRFMLKSISLFSGAGGLDLGFEAAGVKTAVALDLDPIACKVYGAN